MTRKILCTILLFLFTFSAHANSKPIDNLIVFGDSLSDNGNFYVLDRGVRPLAPYYFGRYSNGLVWVEILTHQLGLSPDHLTDKAIAGAQTEGFKPPGLKAQIDTYLNEHPILDAHGLYIIWSGGDNFLDNPAGNRATVNVAIEDLQYSINQLASHGAQYILVPNLPDIGTIPYAKVLDRTHPKQKLSANLTKLSTEYNQRLAHLLPSLQATLSINIMTIDIFSLMHDMMADPTSYGLNNASDPCYVGGEFTGGTGQVCATPDTYLFWDTIHPTLAGHEQIAVYAMQSLEAGLSSAS